MPELTYNPAIFNVNDLRSAMRIILTPETWTTERRWEIETPYLVDLIHQSVEIAPQTVLLDYGSGIGRIAKELIARYQCRVVGVDISASMRALAAPYFSPIVFSPVRRRCWKPLVSAVFALTLRLRSGSCSIACDRPKTSR